MDQDTVARILFAETKGFLADSRARAALSDARLALATAIQAANGAGYSPAVEPSAVDLVDDANRDGWRDCRTQARLPPDSGVIGPISIFDDQALTAARAIPALAPIVAAGAVRTFGPFQDLDGKPRFLHMFANQAGVDPGRYPRDAAHPVTPDSSRVRGLAARAGHGTMLGLALAGFVVVLGLLGYWAYDKGTVFGAWSSAARVSEFQGRLSDAITKAVPDQVAPDVRLTTVAGQVPAAVAGACVAAPAAPNQASAPVPCVGQASGPSILNTLQTRQMADAARAKAVAAITWPASVTAAHRAPIETKISDAIAAAVVADPLFQVARVSLVTQWLAAAVAMAAIIGIAGCSIRGTLLGAMIDSRNRLSLSLVQMAGWTVLVMSLFYVTALFLIAASPETTVLPAYNYGIWALLGLSIGSAAASRVILMSKDQRTAADANTGNAAPTSVLDKRDDPDAWSVADLFLGEEVANSDNVDLSRLQQVIITATLMIVFAGMIMPALSSIGVPPVADWAEWAKNAVPDLTQNDTFLGLLAVSHGGYLLFKGLPKQTGTTDGTGGPPAS